MQISNIIPATMRVWEHFTLSKRLWTATFAKLTLLGMEAHQLCWSIKRESMLALWMMKTCLGKTCYFMLSCNSYNIFYAFFLNQWIVKLLNTILFTFQMSPNFPILITVTLITNNIIIYIYLKCRVDVCLNEMFIFIVFIVQFENWNSH